MPLIEEPHVLSAMGTLNLDAPCPTYSELAVIQHKTPILQAFSPPRLLKAGASCERLLSSLSAVFILFVAPWMAVRTMGPTAFYRLSPDLKPTTIPFASLGRAHLNDRAAMHIQSTPNGTALIVNDHGDVFCSTFSPEGFSP